MNNKKFFGIFGIAIALIFLGIMVMNLLIDPFGLFYDIYDWDGYNFTQNPRTAKINYIDGKDQFDSYIVGSSGAGSIRAEKLSQATGNNYYNMFYYGSDLADSYHTIKYLSSSKKVENIFLVINYNTAIYYDVGEDNINQRMHGKVVDKNLLDFYKTYLFANPKYSLSKIKDSREDSFFQKGFDVFIAESGDYDKTLRDVEGIGNLEEYLERESYQVFKDYPKNKKSFGELDNFKKTMTDIKKLCQKEDINLELILIPIYWEDFDNYASEDLDMFYRSLGEITDFWDFTKSTISKDPRYFYDSSHFRNSIGDMIIKRIYGQGGSYIPEDFGRHVTKDNLEDFLEDFKNYDFKQDYASYTAKFPVLMYHDIGQGDYAISEEEFHRQMKLLKNQGYETISLNQAYDYVEKGSELPQKPIFISFDDGYRSNYEIAYPILKDLDMKACIFTIGHSIGKDSYKDTGQAITPHFNLEEAREMVESDHIEIQSHSYDMHQSEKLEDKDQARVSVERFQGESEEDYIRAFKEDFQTQNKLLREINGEDIHSFSYPTGYYSTESQALLRLLGVRSSFTSDLGVNRLIKGLPQSLYGLKRINVHRGMEDWQLLEAIDQ